MRMMGSACLGFSKSSHIFPCEFSSFQSNPDNATICTSETRAVNTPDIVTHQHTGSNQSLSLSLTISDLLRQMTFFTITLLIIRSSYLIGCHCTLHTLHTLLLKLYSQPAFQVTISNCLIGCFAAVFLRGGFNVCQPTLILSLFPEGQLPAAYFVVPIPESARVLAGEWRRGLVGNHQGTHRINRGSGEECLGKWGKLGR